MRTTKLNIEEIRESNIDALKPLVKEFVATHQGLSFREDYLDAFRGWCEKGLKDEDILFLCGKVDNNIVGFITGKIQENGPLLSPQHVGHISILVVDKKYRGLGIGKSLWEALRDWFFSKEISHFELYTDVGNDLSGPFWKNRGFETFLEKRTSSIEKP